jgi:hypothetical protein
VTRGVGRRWISGLTVGLAAFVLANASLDLALAHLPGQPQEITALDYAGAALRGVGFDDSWRPMRLALAHLDAPGATPVYQALFFEGGIKFQYPPSSLLPLAALRAAFGPGAVTDLALNRLARLAAVATAALVAWLLARAAAASPATAPAGRADAALRTACVLALAAGFYPLVRGLYLGQLQTFVDLLFAGLALAWLAGRPALAGALAGLACALKPTLGLLGLWGLVRRHARFTLAFAATLGLLAAASGLLHGFSHFADYARLLAHVAERGEVFQPNQSLNGLAHRLVGSGDPLRWSPVALAPYHPAVHAVTLAGGLAFAWLALGYRRGDARGAELEDLCVAALAATVAAPIAWEHHYGIALAVFAVALPRTLASPGGRGGAILLGLAYALLGHDVEALVALAGGPASPLASYLLAGALLLLAQCLRLRRARHAAAAAPAPA